MTLFHRFISILRWLCNRTKAEQALDDELRAFIDISAAEKMRDGLQPAEARRLALLELGGIEQAKERVRTYRHGALLDDIGRDVRYAFRSFRRSPGVAAMSVASLALGIGANTAIFTLVDAVMLRTLPVRAPDELVAVGDPSRPTAVWEGPPMLEVLSYPLYRRLRDQNRVFTGLLAAGKAGRIEMAIAEGAPEAVRGRLVSSNYFDVLGVSAVFGRTFTADDEGAPGGHPVVVVSDDFWHTRFGRDPGVLERTIRLNGVPFTVIGVGPPDFTGEVVGSPTDIWIPLAAQPLLSPDRLNRIDSNWLLGLGRLAARTSVAQARAELTILAQQALADFEGANLSADTAREIRAKKLPVESAGKGFSWVRKNESPMLFVLMAVVGLVLLIACANVANLLLARAVGRQREISVRLAMGASRGRLVRQLLTEGAVLAIIGGAAGLTFAGWGSRLFTHLASRGGPNPVPFDVDVQPDLAVLGFTAAVSALTTMLCALVPALRSTRIDLAPALKESPRGPERGGWSFGRVLVAGQVALSVPLLITASLFVRTLGHLEGADVGYSRDHLILVHAEVTGSHSAPTAQRLVWARGMIQRLRSIPGVMGVTVSENGLFTGTDSGTAGLQIEGFHPSRREDTSSQFDQVGPRYFQTLGIPLVAGREFDERDTTGTPLLAIINETMATFYFGNKDPLGKVIQNGGDRYTIVGVVKDNRQKDVKGRPERRFYIALLQTVDRVSGFNFAIRTHGEATALIPTIRREMQGLDSNLRISSIESVHALISQTLSGERSMAQLSGFFGILALLLTVVGLYGVTSYATSRRTGEIGVRMALGADRSTVIRMVVRDALIPMAAGLTIGIPAAFAAARLIAWNLTGVDPIDPIAVGTPVLLMLVAGVCAGLIPSIRASHIDPAKALRQE